MDEIQQRNGQKSAGQDLKARAALAHLSLSDYLLAQLRESLDRPTYAEVRERLPRYGDTLTPSPADVIRSERDGR